MEAAHILCTSWYWGGGGENLFFAIRFDGIVVAVEHKSLLLEAMEQEEQVSIEKDLKVGACVGKSGVVDPHVDGGSGRLAYS